jgi:hypothetical protein
MSTKEKIKKIRSATTVEIIVVAILVFVLGGSGIALSKNTNAASDLSTPLIQLTGWRISHLFLHLMLGALFPTKFVLFFCLGIVWEIIEYAIGILTDSSWWGESLWAHCQDVIANSIGFLIGMLIACKGII